MPTSYRNRIVGYGEESIDQVQFNPKNWRIHPQGQQDALHGVLSEVGWVQNVIVNRNTGNLIDGHARVMLADRNEEKTVPVTYVDLSESEEALILASLDPIAALAATDKEKLEELLRDCNTGSAGLQAMLAELAEDNQIIPGDDDSRDPFGPDGDDEEDTTNELPMHCGDYKFPTDNEYGIPTLKLDMQVQACELPMIRWGSISRNDKFPGGTYHFYTDDYKFTNLWKDPSVLPQFGCRSAIEPNWSTGDNFPRSLVLWCTFRKRWMARYWQENGVRIMVDLNVDDVNAADNLIGVPRGWKAYCTRGYADFVDSINRQYEIAGEHAGCDPLFVVYGGVNQIAKECQRRGWVHITEDVRKKRGLEL